MACLCARPLVFWVEIHLVLALPATAVRWRLMTRYLHTMYRSPTPREPRLLRGARLRIPARDAHRPRRRKGGDQYFFGVPGQDEELELTFNHDGRSYELGTGYGHIAIGVDDLDGTLARLREQGIEPERAPYSVREGGSRLCFVQDPDSYRIELIERSDEPAPIQGAPPRRSRSRARCGRAREEAPGAMDRRSVPRCPRVLDLRPRIEDRGVARRCVARSTVRIASR